MNRVLANLLDQRSLRAAQAALVVWLLLRPQTASGQPAGGSNGASGMPWESPLQNLITSLTGPVAKAIGIAAIVCLGIGIALSEGGSMLRKALFVVFGLAQATIEVALGSNEGRAGSGTRAGPLLDSAGDKCPVVDVVAKCDIFEAWRLGVCMAFSLPLPPPWDSQGWKVKIRDRERLEPPHVTVLHRTRAWRWNLRTGGFLDADPPPGDVPTEIIAVVSANLTRLRAEWDAMYPSNPVMARRGDDE